MNASARLTLLAVWLLVGLGLTGWGETTATHFKVKGDTALAVFFAADPQDPCIEYVVSVVAADLMEKSSPGGGPATTVRVVLNVSVRDVCEHVELFTGTGDVSQATFQVASDLSSATLRTTMPVLELNTGQFFDFDVNLTWTALGPPKSHHETERFQDKDLRILVVAQFRGTQVDAQATGTVVGLGLTFTPAPSTSAELLTQNDGILTIQMMQ